MSLQFGDVSILWRFSRAPIHAAFREFVCRCFSSGLPETRENSVDTWQAPVAVTRNTKLEISLLSSKT